MKIVIWITLFFLTFIGAIAGVYFAKDTIISKTQKKPAHEESQEESHALAGDDSTHGGSPVDSLIVVVEGLVSQLSERVKELQERDVTIEDLKSQIAKREAEIGNLKIQLTGLDELQQMKLKQEERIQGLSKTISSIKPEVLKPMLANLPDEVVKIIYDKAKVKDRAKIISALPAERSGRIVRQIAGESVGEAAHD
jgi:hypothetical protein